MLTPTFAENVKAPERYCTATTAAVSFSGNIRMISTNETPSRCDLPGAFLHPISLVLY